MLDGIRVDYYGTPTPLNQVGNLAIPEPTLITIQPWDPSLLQAIEKALRIVRPRPQPAERRQDHPHAGPPLTEERRKNLVKHAHKHAEEGRVAMRNVRRDVNEHLKKLLKDHEISEDDEKQALAEVQKLTDLHIDEDRRDPQEEGSRNHGGVGSRRMRAACVSARSPADSSLCALALSSALHRGPAQRRHHDPIHADGSCTRRIEYRLERVDSATARPPRSSRPRTRSGSSTASPPASPGA